MIKLEQVVKTYQMGQVEVRALRGVDLHIKTGEMVAIVGPSGSGKSTLMNILGCLDVPTSGKYYMDSTDTGKLSDNQLAEIRNKKIGFVFQSFNLLSRTSAVANVELPLLYSNGHHRRARALASLARVGLATRAHHKPNELSGGEQQRVAIARSLINNPSIILADEPTGNLDTSTSLEIMALFQELNRRDGITIVLITHEPDIAAHCQRIVRMLDGKISSDEPVAQPRTAVESAPRPR